MNRLMGYFLALVILLGIAYFIIAHLSMGTTPVQTSADMTGTQMTVVKVNEDSATSTINVQYPQFGIPNIDAQIKTAVENAIADFNTLPANPPNSATPKNTFDGSFDSVYVGPDVVSVKLILSQYTGGAHPMTLFSGLNFNRATGKQLLQDDAFKMIGLTVNQVSEQTSAQFQQKFGDAFFVDGANTNPENFSSFVISADKVTFIFQEYQVAAYAAGPQQVSFQRVK